MSSSASIARDESGDVCPTVGEVEVQENASLGCWKGTSGFSNPVLRAGISVGVSAPGLFGDPLCEESGPPLLAGEGVDATDALSRCNQLR